MVRLDWNEAKRQANVRKHGIDFGDLAATFDGYTLTVEDDRFDYGERRYVTFGLLEGRVVSIVHAEEEDLIRIIPARKATKNEADAYFSKIVD